MKTTINERIAHLINAIKLNKATFANSINKTPTTIQTIVNGRSKPGFEVLEAIIQTYPQVSRDWLLAGEGEMFRSGNSPVAQNQTTIGRREADQPNEAKMYFQDKYIDLLVEQLESQKGDNRELREINRELRQSMAAMQQKLDELVKKPSTLPTNGHRLPLEQRIKQTPVGTVN